MKKKIAVMIVAFLGITIGIKAQSNEREILIDKIVGVSLNQLDRVNLIQTVKEYSDEMDPIVAEAVVYTLARQMSRPLVAETYANLTEEQLKEVLRFMRSDTQRRISSSQVSEELSVLLAVDLIGYFSAMLSGTSWRPDIPSLNDKEYSAMVDKYLELTGALSLFDDLLKPAMAEIKKEMGASAASMMSSMMKQIQKNYPAYYKSVLVDYVSKEQLQQAVDFYSQPYMLEVQQMAKSRGMSLISENVYDTEDFAKQIEKFLEKNAVIEDTSAVVKNYIAQLPYMLVYNGVKPIFPIKTLKMKKGATYTGQTRDGLAHGKGILTDKKGIRYSGDFREGKRHGLITTYYLDGDSARYVWANDKILAECGIDLSKLAPTYKGEAMGYGYKTSLTGKEEGFFIDGSLEGLGKRIESDDKIEEGWFDGGSLKEGRTIDRSNANKIVQFDGEILSDDLFNGTIKVGVTKIVEKKGGKKLVAIKEGTFVNGVMHGMGSWEYGEDGYKKSEEGYFAYDELYGQGHRTRKWDEGNMVETYDGEFLAGKYHGKGVRDFIYTDKYNFTYTQMTKGYFNEGELKGDMEYDELITHLSGNWTFTRFGFGLKFYTTATDDSLTIHIKGPVTKDKLNGEVEITLSNGDYYKGVFKNGVFKEGVTRKTNADGSVYEGEMKNGWYEGQGKLTEANGNSDEGIFNSGSCVDGVRKDKRGKVLYKIKRRW